MEQKPHSRDDFEALREAVAFHRQEVQPGMSAAIGLTAAERDLQRLFEQLEAAHALIRKTIYRTPGYTGPDVWWKAEADVLLGDSNSATEPPPWTTQHDGVLDHIDRVAQSPASEPSYGDMTERYGPDES